MSGSSYGESPSADFSLHRNGIIMLMIRIDIAFQPRELGTPIVLTLPRELGADTV
jgi:hypothetical protein